MNKEIISISVTSGYDDSTKEPYVEMKVPKQQVLMSPETARDLALSLLQATEGAYSAAFLTEFATEVMDVSQSDADALVSEFRKWRDTEQDW